MMVALCINLQGCSLIDDDLSVCGTDFEIMLEMQLVTNLDLELETTLSAQTDLYTRTILHNYFSHIFTDHAHDITIGFFSTENDELVHSIHDIIDATQSTYTFYLPKDNYHAIALANLNDNGVVSLTDSTNSRLARLITLSGDTLPTQQTGLFAVDREIEVQDTADQKIDLVLHMASSAFALVIDTGNVPIKGIRAVLCNTADGLMLRDSLYTFDRPKTIRMEEIEAAENSQISKLRVCKFVNDGSLRASCEEDTVKHYLMFGCASFPSPDEPDGYGNYYEAKVYVDLPDGTTTETVLTLREPLRAAQLKIVKLELQMDGQVIPLGNNEVGVSVTLDWKEGTEYNPEI